MENNNYSDIIYNNSNLTKLQKKFINNLDELEHEDLSYLELYNNIVLEKEYEILNSIFTTVVAEDITDPLTMKKLELFLKLFKYSISKKYDRHTLMIICTYLCILFQSEVKNNESLKAILNNKDVFIEETKELDYSKMYEICKNIELGKGMRK